MQIHADLGQRALVLSEALPWVASPMTGVERRMLERDGAEVARATSIVRYAPASAFAPHTHGGGEEFLVLDGVFSDEHGDFGPDMYVRNPPGSRHTPASGPGCTIFVKLRQMADDDQTTVRIDTGSAAWQPGAAPGVEVLPLHRHGRERVALYRLAPGAALVLAGAGGIELFVLAGECEDAAGRYPRGAWLRLPAGSELALHRAAGCRLYVKTGHLGPIDAK